MIWETKKRKSVSFHFFPIYLPWSDVTECLMLVFWMLSFQLAFSLSSFTLIKRLFSFSSVSVIRVESSSYQRLLIFLPAILIPAFQLGVYLDHQFIWFTLHINWISRVTIDCFKALLSQFWTSLCCISSSNYYFLTCIQVTQETGKVAWYYHNFKNFPQFVAMHAVKGFNIVK